MRIATVPDSWLERVAMWAGLVPTPILDTFHAAAVARSIMVATKLGVFESLAEGGKNAAAVASSVAADELATEKLLNVLVTARYLRFHHGNYRLTRITEKWLLKDSPASLRDHTLFRFLEWEAIERLESYVRTGQHLDVHDQIKADQWEIYQRGMRSIAGMSAAEVVRRVPIVDTATRLLDIGGSHGFYSVSFCRRHPNLQATILDLPSAVDYAADILAEEQMGDRVVHRIGDARTENLGVNEWDVVFVSHLIHHFDAETNRSLFLRIGKGMKQNGILAVLDAPRVQASSKTGQTAALLDLFFAMTSNSGCWPTEQVNRWMDGAGLEPLSPVPLQTAPGLAVFLGRKR